MVEFIKFPTDVTRYRIPSFQGNNLNCPLPAGETLTASILDEEYEQAVLRVVAFMKLYSDLVVQHPELVIPAEHNSYGGCAYLEQNFFKECKPITLSDEFYQIWRWFSENFPSFNLDGLYLHLGGFPLETIEDGYAPQYDFN